MRLAVNFTEAAIDAAVAGVGIARVLSYQIVDKLRSGALVPLLEPFAPEAIPVQLVYAAQGQLPIKARAFLDWIAPRLRALPAARNAMTPCPRQSSLAEM